MIRWLKIYRTLNKTSQELVYANSLKLSVTLMLWHERRFYSIDSYLKTTYGEKIYKISLDGGMTCPNRDGTLDNRGCIFCSAGGSGDFATSRRLSITEQIEVGKQQSAGKFQPKEKNHFRTTGQANEEAVSTPSSPRYIAYFQAYTNTYAPADYLRKIFTEAAMHPDIVLLSIATRPDCLDTEVLEVLSEIQKIKPVWIELGLQTIHEQTASFIRRGYDLTCFDEAVQKLHERNIPIIVHTILGLPGENKEQMLETIDYVTKLPIFGIKLQLLHILKGTDLADYYVNLPFQVLTQDDYVNLIIDIIERLPQTITVHRLTGDGPRELLIEPKWSLNKKQVLNNINKRLKELNTWQGRKV